MIIVVNTIQALFVSAVALFNLVTNVIAFRECKYKKNAFGLTPFLWPFGIYVWGDAVVFGFFWFFASVVSIFLNDWLLFLLIVSVFWLVRSVGETIYWFNEQFSTVNRNDPRKLPFHTIFHNDSVWFIFQISNQCITVVTIITTVYLFHFWLKGM